MPIVELADTTYGRLQAIARPFEDTPDSVITRLLDGTDGAGLTAAGPGPTTPPQAKDGGRRRAQVGTILPERNYWVPILRALEERGGSAPAPDAIDRVGELLADSLTDDDREQLDSGEIRWRNRAQFARLRMKELGYLKKGSPRGVWEITADGREYLTDNS